MNVTKEDVDKAEAALAAAEAAWDASHIVGVSADWDAFDKAVAAWDKYLKLKKEYELDESGE